MRTRFGPDDEDAFYAAQHDLMAAYASDVDGAGSAPDTFVATTMLEYKWGYGDGRVYDWRRADLEAVLLGHFPRKVTMDEEDLLRVAPEVADFLAFLDGRGLLTGDPLPALRQELDDLVPDFVDAMQDSTRFGLAKRLVSQMQAEGVDIGEQASIDGWISELNARSRDERHDILHGPEAEVEALEPIELPPATDLERAAIASPKLSQLTAFARYVGKGQKLTQQGYLTLADGRVLVGLLDTGDELDARVGDRVFVTRSTGDLPRLDLVFRWARAARFVKVQHGRVSITRRGTSLGAKPLEDWRAAFEGYLKHESVGSGRHHRLDGPFWSEVIDEIREQLPLWLYAQTELEVDALHEAAWHMVDARYFLYHEPVVLESLRRSVGYDVDRTVLGDLADLGAVTIADGKVSLTALGLWATNRMLRERGVPAPVAGEQVGSDAPDLLRACATMPLDAAEREIRSWIEARPETAARELAEAARSGILPMMALHALGFAGAQGEAEVRAMLQVEHLRPKAQMWLVGQGYEDPSSMDPETLQAAFLEAMAVQIDAAGPVAAVASFQSLGPVEEQLAFVERLLRSDHPRTSEVLDIVGRYHPSKLVAKGARKTTFKRQAIRPT